MASYKIAKYIIFRKFAIRDKHLSSLLLCDRHFCSKDNEAKTDKISSEVSPSKDQEENNNKKTVRAKKSSFKARVLDDSTKAAATEKLMSLLSEITVTSDKPVKPSSRLNLAKPQKRMLKKDRLKQMQDAMITPEKEMDMAVKAVASSFKEESEKVESELTAKLNTLKLSLSEEVPENVETDEDVIAANSEFNNEMNENLMSSVEEVADEISESPIPPRSELAKRLMRLSLDQKAATEKKSMRSVIEGMSIESQHPAPPPRTSPEIEEKYKEKIFNNEMNENLMSSVEEVADEISESPIPPRSELAKRLMRLSLDQKVATEKKSMGAVIKGMTIESQQPAPPPPPPEIEERYKVKIAPPRKKIGKVNLFGFDPLNIFTPDAEAKADSTNKFWNTLQERELKLMTQFAPANAFEEMIMWTEQGKHWKFPINNEIDMAEEEKYGFHEHVFLERHLKGFPTKGPIRHFMELVVVGLSKNPYINVDRKLENIEWFRNYFEEKKEILREEGVLD